MVDDSIVNRRYSYIRESKWPVEAIDLHHVVVRRSRANRFFMRLSVVAVLANSLYLVLVKVKCEKRRDFDKYPDVLDYINNESVTFLFWSLMLSGLVVKLMLWKPVEKESVIIIPALGVQLETHYLSGKILRRFFPIGKILRPALLECVTPVTCYWSLSLVLHDEDELTLVFKELHPPVKMLVPVWKALCAIIDDKERPDTEND